MAATGEVRKGEVEVVVEEMVVAVEVQVVQAGEQVAVLAVPWEVVMAPEVHLSRSSGRPFQCSIEYRIAQIFLP